MIHHVLQLYINTDVGSEAISSTCIIHTCRTLQAGKLANNFTADQKNHMLECLLMRRSCASALPLTRRRTICLISLLGGKGPEVQALLDAGMKSTLSELLGACEHLEDDVV